MSDQSSHASIDPLNPRQPIPGDSDATFIPTQPAHPEFAPQTDESFSNTPDDSPTSISSESSHDTPAHNGEEIHRQPDQQETVISKSPPLSAMPSPVPSNPLEMGVALEGETLGHYHLEKFVGGGGMGAVFRANDSMLNRTVAVKVLSRGQNDEEIQQRFKNEAQSAARLDHDNIARVHYVGQDKGWHYIVFEYIEGLNIRDYVGREGPLPLEAALNFTLQVAEALEHAHQRDVVHRDIKPSNVLVTPEGHVKLVDMGLARLHQVESTEHDLTASGVTLGTFDYISPEQARDPRNADVRSDLYSLGCTLYFMLTGRPPFPKGTVLQKLLSHTSDERPDARLYRPELPDEIVDVLNRLLDRQPDQRFQEPNELIGELLLLVEQLGLHGASRGGTVWISSDDEKIGWWQRSLPIILPIVGLVFAVILLDRFWPIRDTANSNSAIPWGTLNTEISDGKVNANSSQPDNAEPDGTDKNPSTSPDPMGKDDENLNPIPDTKPPNSISIEPVDLVSVDAANSIDSIVGDLRNDSYATVGLPSTNAEVRSYENEVVALAVGDSAGQQLAVDDLRPDVIPIPTRLLIVSPILRDDIPVDADLVMSLDEACRRAADLPKLEAIELWFDGPLMVEPFQIAAESLTIRAGQNYHPELVFEPIEKDFAVDGRMIGLIGGEVSWKGIHFVMRLPLSSPGWSLFHLDSVVAVDLRDCTMTIDNVNKDGQQLQNMVAFFEIEEPPFPEMTSDDTKMVVTAPPSINLKRCFARGQATLVRAEEATPFNLNWEQGLLVTNERMLEISGATVDTWTGRMRVHLNQVTCVLGKGIAFIGADPIDAPYQIHLHFEAHNSIFDTDPEVALIEHAGIPDTKDLEKDMEFNASFCYFHRNGILWRVVPNDGVLSDFRLEPKLMESSPAWFKVDENKVDLITPSMWNEPVETENEVKHKYTLAGDKNVLHTYTTSDYVLRDSLNQPNSQTFAGFDSTKLPAIKPPANLEASDTPATNSSTDD